MPTTYKKLMALRSANLPYRYDERDTLLYAVSIGMGRDPANTAELPYIFEKLPLRTVPSQAIVVARQRLIWDVGLDIGKMLHGEQKLSLHRPLPPSAELLADAHIAEVYDKGPGKGSILQIEGSVRNAADNAPLFSWASLVFARGDGGIGGSAAKAPAPHEMPTRAPDVIATAETRPEQAALYRLNGDRNLVHIDPEVARSAGFPRPILHGACTYAIACREVLAHICAYDDTRIATFDVRFTSVVFPGEQVETHLWRDGDVVSFKCRVPQRNVVVLDHGRCELRSPA